MDRPGKIGLGGAVRPASAGGDQIEVAKMVDPDSCEASTRPDIGRDAPPGTEIDIGVEEPNQFRFAGRIAIGEWAVQVIVVERVKAGLAAIFTRDIEPQP